MTPSSPKESAIDATTGDELRARFDAEISAAGLSLAGRDYELLFAMWTEHRPQREALRAAVPTPDEEPDA